MSGARRTNEFERNDFNGEIQTTDPPTFCPAPLSASDIFLQGMTSEVNAGDITRMVEAQNQMLSRFEKTNEMLLNFNVLSAARFESTQLDFRRHIQMLVDTKKDLDIVFKRIRVLKMKLAASYPDAFKVCTHIHEVPDDEEEEIEDPRQEYRRRVSSSSVGGPSSGVGGPSPGVGGPTPGATDSRVGTSVSSLKSALGSLAEASVGGETSESVENTSECSAQESERSPRIVRQEVEIERSFEERTGLIE